MKDLLVPVVGVVAFLWQVLRTPLSYLARESKRKRSERAARITRFDRAWSQLMRKLTETEVSGDAISIRYGGIDLKIEPVRNRVLDSERTRIRIIATGGTGVADGLSLLPRDAGMSEGNAAERSEVRTGDRDFDLLVKLQGNPATLLAIFDFDLRRRLVLQAQRYRFRVEHGEIACETRWSVDNLEDLRRGMRWVPKLAHSLHDPGSDTPRCLAKHVVQDRIPGVRLANLLALQNAYPGSTEARRAARSALRDPSPQVRLAGAKHVGPEGFETLFRLAGDRGIDDEQRIDALRYLAEHAPRAKLVPLLDDLLEVSSGELLREAIRLCARLRHVEAVPRIVSRSGLDRPLPGDTETVLEAVRAFGEIADASTEPVLQGCLQSEATPLACAAARALGRVGTAATVPVLRERVEGLLTSPPLRAAALEAIAAIQGRLGGAASGQLALSDAAAAEGRLSVVDGSKGGKVSWPEREGEASQ